MTRAWKVSLVALAVLAVAIALAQDNRPADASSNTQIFFSKTNSQVPAGPLASIIIHPNQGYIPLYVWAKNVKGTYGAGNMQIDVQYVSWLLHVDSMAEGDSNNGLVYSGWLGTTGRIDTCADPDIINLPGPAGSARIVCNTLASPIQPPPPPYGPLGNRLMGTLAIKPGPALGVTTITLTPNETWISDTGVSIDNNGDTIIDQVIDPSDIPATITSLQVKIWRCGSVDGSAIFPTLGGAAVGLSDIFFEAGKFGLNQFSPNWNTMYDMDGNLAVGLSDINIIAAQYATYCMPTP